MYVYQSGLTLPDRDYYLKDDEKYVGNREALTQYVGELLKQAGYAGATRAPESVMSVEHFIAENPVGSCIAS